MLKLVLILVFGLILTSCVAPKKTKHIQFLLNQSESNVAICEEKLHQYKDSLQNFFWEQQRNENQKNNILSILLERDKQIEELKMQVLDFKSLRDKQLDAVGNLTLLSKEANENIEKTLSQLATKDRYIYLLQEARSRADSINLALAVNLTSVLRDGIEDKDIEVKIDKTIVLINISDKMLFSTGSTQISFNAEIVLEKIALIILSRPELEVMVEGYTDDVPIGTECILDNWDLSAKRATSVVRILQQRYNINPNKLIAAGRGQYNILANNATEEGRAKNRRTRIILMPKIDQFYDLLIPRQVEKSKK